MAIAVLRDDDHLVLEGVEADVRSRDVVVDEQVGILRAAFLASALEAGLGLVGREPDDDLPWLPGCADGGENISRGLELDNP